MVGHAENIGNLEIQGIGKTFENHEGEKIEAIKALDLSIRSREFVSLLGPSGCGKSTLLHIIAGLDIPTAGTLTLDGEPISKPGFERGLVFQDPNLFPWLSVRKNIEVGLLARKVLKEKRHEVADYIRLVGLQGFEKSFPHKLSGGMAQRVAIARALINHPKVLLMDEPLGALDAFTRMMLQDELLNIWAERQITAVLVTHDIDEAIYMSDRIVIMTPRPGKVQEVIRVNFSRPRRRNDPELFALKSRILDILHFTRAETPLGYYL